MSDTAEYLTESDPDDGTDLPPLPHSPSLPEGIANSRPDAGAPRLQDNRSAPVDEPFNIIETDEHFTPVDGQPQRPEPRLNETEDGPRSYVDRQNAATQDEQARQQRWTKKTPAERRAAAREGRDRTLQELQALRRQNEELVAWREQIEPQLAGIQPRLNEIDQARVQDQIAQLDRGIQEQTARAAAARRQISEAMISQDGEALNNALEQRDDAVMQTQRLTVQRNMAATGDPLGRPNQGQAPRQGDPRAQQQPQPQPQAQRVPLSARAQAMADDFISRHDWLRRADPGDQDWGVERDIVQRLDNEVARQYDPAGLEYWEVLEHRMRQYMPHRFNDPAPVERERPSNGNGAPQRRVAPPPERRGPMVAGSAGGAPQRSGNDVYLSPGRKEALIQSGALNRDGRTVEDPAKFRRTLKQFQDFDRANGTVRQ